MSTKEKTPYELMFIFSPDLTEKEIEDKISHVKKEITDVGGEVTVEDLWGLRDLSYRIRRKEQGYYYVLNFNLAGKELLALEKEFNIDNDILRFLVTKTPTDYQFKTSDEYEKEREEYEKEKEAERQEQEEKNTPKRKKKVEKVEPQEEKEEKKEPKEEKPKKDEKEKSEKKLKQVENKLKDILEDPDLMDI